MKAKDIIREVNKLWWPGDKSVELYMLPVSETLDKYNIKGNACIAIYNRAYETVYKTLQTKERVSG